MADDLSAPLGRKQPAKTKRFGLGFAPNRLPLARIAFGLIALIVVGATLRILLVNDPMGGRPVAEIGVNSTRNTNPVAENVALAPSGEAATITAGPEIPAAGASVSMVGSDVPDGTPDTSTPTAIDEIASAQGLVPGLLEQTEAGAIPRIAPSGETPFDAYRQPAPAGAGEDGKPLIAIVVTGLGLNAGGTSTAIAGLPGTVTLAFAPYGKELTAAVGSARASGHEVLLEVPLEPFDYPESDPGPDTLLTGQPPRDNLAKLFNVMSKFGGYVGVINHMGARFTASSSDFAPLMEELGTRGLGYLDDGSSNRSVAPQLAAANTVMFGRANLVLDAKPARAAILDQLKALEAKATEDGSAIGVISALPVSVQTLSEWVAAAGDRFTLVPVSTLMKKAS